MRTPLILGNWKMNGLKNETDALLRELMVELRGVESSEVGVGVIPPFTVLERARQILEESPIAVGGQDLFWATGAGAFTGEISGGMLRDIGCHYVLTGRSERRAILGEGDEIVARKTQAALTCGLIPVLCVGESLEERESGRAEAVVLEQLDAVFEALTPMQAKKVVVAYEPVWAIGTGRTASPADAQAMHHAIRGRIDHHVPGQGRKTKILYGGSVKSDNAAQLLAQEDIDGALVGGASLSAAQFAAIVRAARTGR